MNVVLAAVVLTARVRTETFLPPGIWKGRDKLLVDSYRRVFSYLRLSLLPVCNFRCVYCLPNGNPQESLHKRHLSRIEVGNLVSAFSELGIRKVRLTGGEPTLRADIEQIVGDISQNPQIKEIGLTTNGFRLSQMASQLKKNGITSINVSVDSLKRKTFHEITGQDRFLEVMNGIDVARKFGISKIKINAVILRGVNDDEVGDFVAWAEREDFHVRFIELMPTQDNGAFFRKRHLSLDFIKVLLEQKEWIREQRTQWGGPAEVWGKNGTRGKVGVIRPYSSNFCDSCNRLRVTSEGALQLCLFGTGNVSLRPLLQQSAQKEELKEFVINALSRKSFAHSLHEGDYGSTRNLAAMGG